MTVDYNRIFIIKLSNFDPKTFSFKDMCKLILIIADVRLKFDDFLSDTYIFDFQGVELSHLTAFSAILFQKLFTVIMVGYIITHNHCKFDLEYKILDSIY